MEGFTPITTQEEFDTAIKARIERERSKFADYEDLKKQVEKMTGEKADFEKTAKESAEKLKGLQTQLDEANKKVKTFETDNLRTKIAIEKGLPLELRSRLTGETEEDIKADADLLAKILGTQNNKGLPGFQVHEHGGEADEKTAAYKELLNGLKINKE